MAGPPNLDGLWLSWSLYVDSSVSRRIGTIQEGDSVGNRGPATNTPASVSPTRYWRYQPRYISPSSRLNARTSPYTSKALRSQWKHPGEPSCMVYFERKFYPCFGPASSSARNFPDIDGGGVSGPSAFPNQTSELQLSSSLGRAVRCWIPTALSTIKPATSPCRFTIRVGLARSYDTTQSPERLVGDVREDLRWVTDETVPNRA